MNVHVEAIRFFRQEVRSFGSRQVASIETGPPMLEASISGDDGSHGSVSIPLNAEECAAIQAAIEGALSRAKRLVGEIADAR